MGNITYQDINSLTEVGIIGGTNYVLAFTVKDENGAAIDIGAATCSWKMSPYGQPEVTILEKPGVITGTSTFTVTLSPADTISLEGKFAHQPIVQDFGGSLFRPAQGVITISAPIITSGTQIIRGTVYYYGGSTPVSGATITFGAYSATSGADGTYALSSYNTSGTLSCSKTGYVWESKTIAPFSGILSGQNFTSAINVDLPIYLRTTAYTLVEDFETVSGWGKTAGMTLTNNTSEFQTGTQSIKATTNCGGSSSQNFWNLFSSSISDIKAARIRFYVHDSNLDSIVVYIMDTSWEKYFQAFAYPYNLGWNIATIPKDAWTAVGGMTWETTPGGLTIKVNTKPEGDTSVSVDTFELYGSNKPSLVITFDDGTSVTYSNAFPHMAEKNVVGTAYIASSLIGGGGRMTEANLLTLNAAGWDIANHSTDSTTFVGGGLTDEQIVSNITTCKNYLDGLGLTRASRHLAYPSGLYNQAVIADAVSAGMLTARTAYYDQPWSLPFVFPYQAHVGSQYGYITNTTSVANIKSYLDRLVSEKLTGMFLLHGVGGVGDISTSDFEEVIDYVVSSGIQTLTISELYTLSSSSLRVHHL